MRSESQRSLLPSLLRPILLLGLACLFTATAVEGQELEVSIEAVTVAEGDEGIRPARFPIRLSSASEATITIRARTFDVTATVEDGDYQSRDELLQFEPGQVEIFFDVGVRGDTRDEGDEFFDVEISLETQTGYFAEKSHPRLSSDRARARCRIKDDDGVVAEPDLPTVRLLPTSPVGEGEGTVVLAAERSGPAQGEVRVAVRTLPGTALPRKDFQPIRRVLRWAAGESGAIEFEVPLVNDDVIEDQEGFRVELVEAEGAEIGEPALVRQVIVDDDRPVGLEAISDLEQTVPVRSELVLQVRTVRDDGRPVVGAPVRWAVRGRARLAGDVLVRSDEDGVVRQTLRLDRVPGPAQVVARLVGRESELEFRLRVVGNLGATTGESNDDAPSVADVLDQACAEEEEGSPFREACEYIFGGDEPQDRAEILEGLTPRQALPHQRQALRAPRNQVRNVSARLSALRGGMKRSAVDQLALSIRGEGLSLAPLQEAIASGSGLLGSTPPALAAGGSASRPWQQSPRAERATIEERSVMEDTVELALLRAAGLAGYGSRADEPADRRTGESYGSADSGTDFDYAAESPWGFFFNGRISFGDGPRLGRRPGFDFETQGLTAGVDRRLGTRWVAGAALGVTQSDTEIERKIGRLDLSGESLSLYTSYFTDRWYVDGVLTYGVNDYDVERVIELPRAFRGERRLVARGTPEANQTAFNLGFGYDFALGRAGTLSGFLRANWTRAEIDSFTETGALLFNLQYDRQVLESLLGEVGVEASYPYSFSWGVLQPLLRVTLLHEFEDEPEALRARFAFTRLDRRFLLASERPDRDFLNVAVAVTATFPHSWSAYFQYDVDLERDDLDLYTLSGGFRFQF